MLNPYTANTERQRELAIYRYVLAFDTGNLDELALVLAEAEQDPELDRAIMSINATLHEEAGLQPIQEQAQLVRKLLLQHLPSGFTDSGVDQPSLTVGDVAARLQSDETSGRQLALPDRLVNQRLLGSKEPLPIPINAGKVSELAARLQINASDRYWELFRRAAVILGITRKQNQIQIAAARLQSGRLSQNRRASDPKKPKGAS